MRPGMKLRELREGLGLTLKTVESESAKIARLKKNEEYLISQSRMSDIETKDVCPGMFRLYSFSRIYNFSYVELLMLYGIDLHEHQEHRYAAPPGNTVMLEKKSSPTMAMVKMPVKMDPGFDLRRTTNVGRMIVEWGYVPLLFLTEMAS